MKTLLLALTALVALSSFAPSAAAAPDLPSLVYVCADGVTAEDCWRGGSACVGFSRQIPQCVGPLNAAPISAPPVPVGVCAKPDSCYGGNDVCVSAFSWVPQCADAPCTDGTCTAISPLPPPPVWYCAKMNSCWGGHDVCVYGFSWVPQCADVPCGDGECTQAAPPAVPVRVCAKPDSCSGYDVCVYAFTWVPICRNVPCTDGECFEVAPVCIDACAAATPPDVVGMVCGETANCEASTEVCLDAIEGVPCVDLLEPVPTAGPNLAPPVSVCVEFDSCHNGRDACVSISRMVPICTNVPCTDGECFAVSDCLVGCVSPQANPEPMCMYWYYEADFGPVRYVQRDSCHSEIYVLGERVR